MEKKEKKERTSTIKGLKKRFSYKKGKPSKMSVTIPEYKAESSWDDPNRFFKDEMEEAKKAMFFK